MQRYNKNPNTQSLCRKIRVSQGLLLDFAWMIEEDCLLLRQNIKMFAYEEENYDFSAVRLDGYGE